jgi:nucleoside-diphosphate-sugar epimerase
MKYFITGATGFIGGQLARQLVNAGHEVVALARKPTKALEALGVKVHQGDITEKESMRAPMTGVDGVFHVAGWYKVGVRDKSMAEAINVQGTRNVLELMKELKIPRGVYTSTIAVFYDTKGKIPDETYRFTGKHISEYDRTKWLAHYEVALPMMQAGLPLSIVQPGVVYGPGDTSVAHLIMMQYLQQTLPMMPTKTAFCWAHVEDTAQGHILAMDKGKPGETYIIGGPPHRVAEVLEAARKIVGIPIPKRAIGPGPINFMATIMNAVGAIVPVPDMFSAESLRGLASTYLGSNTKAKRELGFNPRPFIEEGLRGLLAYEMEQLGIKPVTSP